MTGSHGAKTFSGHFNVARFVSRAGKTYAVGTLTGRLSGRSVKPVANLLNQPSLGSQQATGLLNILQQLISVPGLTNL